MIRSHRGSAEDENKHIRETYLVILVLIAAAAYQTALSPPGGYWQDTKNSTSSSHESINKISPTTAPPPPPPQPADADAPATDIISYYNHGDENHSAGTSIIGTRKNRVGYGLFVISNSVAFHTTVFMICRFTVEFPAGWVMHCLLLILSANYGSCVIMVLPPGYDFLLYLCYIIPGVAFILTLIMLISKRSLMKCGFDN